MKINILKYPVFMRLGYFVGERTRGQDVLVSLVVDLLKAKEIGDNLEKTTDYGQILEVLDLALANKEMKLVETAVEKTGRVLLEHFPQISKVHVTIEKPILPDGIGKSAQISVSSEFHRDTIQC